MSIDRRKNFAKCLYNISSAFTTWHYFLTNLVFVEDDGTNVDCYMNIDVKQNDSGHWFYSFAIEKGSRPADVLSVVTDKSATTSAISITKNAEKINPSDENSSKNLPAEGRVLTSTMIRRSRRTPLPPLHPKQP